MAGAALLPLGLLLGNRWRRRGLLVALALFGLSCGGTKQSAAQVVTITARSGGAVVSTGITVH
jgi:hypothetical protein